MEKSSRRGPGGRSPFGGYRGERSEPEAASIYIYIFAYVNKKLEFMRIRTNPRIFENKQGCILFIIFFLPILKMLVPAIAG